MKQTSQRHDVILCSAQRARLGDVAERLGHAGAAERIGVSVPTLRAALSGAPVMRVTAAAVSAALDMLSDGEQLHRVDAPKPAQASASARSGASIEKR